MYYTHNVRKLRGKYNLTTWGWCLFVCVCFLEEDYMMKVSFTMMKLVKLYDWGFTLRLRKVLNKEKPRARPPHLERSQTSNSGCVRALFRGSGSVGSHVAVAAGASVGWLVVCLWIHCLDSSCEQNTEESQLGLDSSCADSQTVHGEQWTECEGAFIVTHSETTGEFID